MSIRTVLIGTRLVNTGIAVFLIGALGVYSIRQSVEKETQARVTHDLGIVSVYLWNQLELLAQSIEQIAATISLTEGDLHSKVRTIRRDLNLSILNLCDINGRPITGTYPDQESTVPLVQDAVLRKALKGKTVWGMMPLDAERLELEGGAALQNAAIVYSKTAKDEKATQTGLFLWVASPLFDERGQIIALLYGGRLLNYNFDLVDDLREKIFSSELYNGKPLGTVTIFLDDLRVATNVIGPDGKRAIGTVVSQEVRRKVLEENQEYLGRAWVVDRWYVSGYQPIHDPDGQTIGILYVGLLEEPYTDLRTQLLIKFLVPATIILLIAFLTGFFIVNRIIGPLHTLRDAASRLAIRDWREEISIPRTYSELVELASVFRNMQQAIKTRDQQLTEQNRQLTETNEKLETANRNYMQMLGFVTHELKSPLASTQSMIAVMLEGFVEGVPDKVKNFLIRINRNSEELQDMVKDYLELSRAERDELIAHKSQVNFHEEVVTPCVEQTQSLFDSRGVTLTVTSPENLIVHADPELMRIALTNYLTNAAKYGTENKQAILTVAEEQGFLTISVWNEGTGFTTEEKDRLFQKFSRLKSPNTADKRGSGLGLFLVKRILELHDGKVWAESESGQWAKFSFKFPNS